LSLPAPYYEDDAVQIFHGDCRELLPFMPAVDLVLTDPPYGIAYQHGERKGGARLGFDGIAANRMSQTVMAL